MARSEAVLKVFAQFYTATINIDVIKLSALRHPQHRASIDWLELTSERVAYFINGNPKVSEPINHKQSDQLIVVDQFN